MIMYESEQEKSKAILAAEEAVRRANQQLSNAKKKDRENRRKMENHHKYMMGGIIVKYLPECYQFDENELNQILSTAIRTLECQQIIEQIKEQDNGTIEGTDAVQAGEDSAEENEQI